MTEIRAREPVLLAEDVDRLVSWYCDHLGFLVERRFDEQYHYVNLKTPSGFTLGIGEAPDDGTRPEPGSERAVLQIEVDDVGALLAALAAAGAGRIEGPSRDAVRGFWFGAFADPEGNPWWVVDRDCP